MRIGIDGRELCGRPTGVGRYLSGLLTEWCRPPSHHGHEFILYSHEPAAAVPVGSPLLRARILPGRPGTWWEQVRLPAAVAEDELNVFFAPGYTAPLRLAVGTVAAIHDVSFAAHPEWFTTREGLRRRWLAARTASAARVVLTISEFSRREIIDHLGVIPSKVRVIPPGVRPFSGGSVPRPDARVLYVGSIFNRRHVPDLIHAFAPIARRGLASLDLVGDNRTHPRQDPAAIIEREGLAARVRWRQYVSDEELGGLYASARAFAFLSDYEGLGLPPLEALAAGVPAVLLETPVARESCGNAALYVDRPEAPLVAAALEQLLFDEPARRQLLAAAPAVLARYSWPAAARRTLAVLEEAGS